jgi:hypothetical protein
MTIEQWNPSATPRTDPAPNDDEPSVMGGGVTPTPMPSKADAEEAWRRLYVARMVERGVDQRDARACCDAGDVNLSENPADAADSELEYWGES